MSERISEDCSELYDRDEYHYSCEDCLHKNVCFDSANYRSAESCRHYAAMKRGHWIPSENKTFICSECGYGFEHEGYIHFFNFCPGCGVRIEGVMDKTDTIAEKPFAILNCPECGGEVDMGKMKFCTGKKSASALFECKKCHYYRNVMAEYTNNPQTALMLAWNDYVVSREAYKTVKSDVEEIARNRVPVDCVKCRFYDSEREYCRKYEKAVFPFCFCFYGEEWDRTAIDSITIVRCKDCKYLEISGCYGECGKGYLGIVRPDCYCCYGERRDDNG